MGDSLPVTSRRDDGELRGGGGRGGGVMAAVDCETEDGDGDVEWARGGGSATVRPPPELTEPRCCPAVGSNPPTIPERMKEPTSTMTSVWSHLSE